MPTTPAEEQFADELRDLELEIKTDHYDLTSGMEDRVIRALSTHLAPICESFPVSELHLDITRNPPDRSFEVTSSLRLPGRTLVVREVEDDFYPAFKAGLESLIRQVKAHKEKLEAKERYAKEAQGTVHRVEPAYEPDVDALEEAVEAEDWSAFRDAIEPYVESVEKRVGQWVQRYDDTEAMVGEELALTEIVEAVLLDVFDHFADRPADRLGNWIEHRIDPVVRRLTENPDLIRDTPELRYLREVGPDEERT